MPSRKSQKAPLAIVGWREWVALPDLRIPRVKAKVDTGARSSSLHAFDIEAFRRRGRRMVRFKVHPLQRDSRRTVKCEAEIHDERLVRSSTGHAQHRYVIHTCARILDRTVDIEVTLASRDAMGFRMLLGREALRRRFLVDSGRSFLGGKPVSKKKRQKKP